MTRLSISTPSKGQHAILGDRDAATASPMFLMQRVDAAMSWLHAQESPHEVVMDDPSGIVAAMIVAWALTCAYPCNIRFIGTDESHKLQIGIDNAGHAYINAWDQQ